MFNFTPTEKETAGIPVPYWEAAKANYAPYYEAGRNSTVQKAQDAVLNEMAKLGAGGVRFVEGYFGGKPRRHGYVVTFQYMGGEGRIQVAGLPMSGAETAYKLQNVRVQALLNVCDWLKAAVTAQVFSPGSYPRLQRVFASD